MEQREDVMSYRRLAGADVLWIRGVNLQDVTRSDVQVVFPGGGTKY